VLKNRANSRAMRCQPHHRSPSPSERCRPPFSPVPRIILPLRLLLTNIGTPLGPWAHLSALPCVWSASLVYLWPAGGEPPSFHVALGMTPPLVPPGYAWCLQVVGAAHPAHPPGARGQLPRGPGRRVDHATSPLGASSSRPRSRPKQVAAQEAERAKFVVEKAEAGQAGGHHPLPRYDAVLV